MVNTSKFIKSGGFQNISISGCQNLKNLRLWSLSLLNVLGCLDPCQLLDNALKQEPGEESFLVEVVCLVI